jgi:hypothetical protein
MESSRLTRGCPCPVLMRLSMGKSSGGHGSRRRMESRMIIVSVTKRWPPSANPLHFRRCHDDARTHVTYNNPSSFLTEHPDARTHVTFNDSSSFPAESSTVHPVQPPSVCSHYHCVIQIFMLIQIFISHLMRIDKICATSLATFKSVHLIVYSVQ